MEESEKLLQGIGRVAALLQETVAPSVRETIPAALIAVKEILNEQARQLEQMRADTRDIMQKQVELLDKLNAQEGQFKQLQQSITTLRFRRSQPT